MQGFQEGATDIVLLLVCCEGAIVTRDRDGRRLAGDAGEAEAQLTQYRCPVKSLGY